ncbi:MAG: GNAT family N-acetyltransferase [Verrucomicrobiales bacterium]
MRTVQLVRLDPVIEETLMKDSTYIEAMAREDWMHVAEHVHRLVGRTLAVQPVSVDKLEWCGYFVVDQETREVVGSCAFKAPPTNEGAVEIAYFTYPGVEGQGYATAMATKLITMASDAAEVQQVIAHTLPEVNASTRVLEKAGMTFVGEVIDPEDGRVWRWCVTTKAEPSASPNDGPATSVGNSGAIEGPPSVR